MINQTLLLAGDDAYNLSKSLRFRSSASAYLNRTPASASNRTTWTWSGWVKRGNVSDSATITLFSAGTFNNDDTVFRFDGNYIDFFNRNSSTTNGRITTTAVYRDPSASYHVVIAWDTTQSTSSNRIKLYVNGTQVTSLQTATYPSQNQTSNINNNVAQYLGVNAGATSQYFDGYLTEVNFIDGQALTPSSFGETDLVTGVWKPKKYAGTYGTNGFYLPFTDVATTSGSNAGLGKDFSGNGNYWNTNNISVTAGTTYDSMNDVPTLTSATQANYCVLNPLDKNTNTALTNGNLDIASATSGTAVWYPASSTIKIPTSGKWYCEMIVGSADTAGYYRQYFGIITDTFPITTTTGIGNSTQGWAYFPDTGAVNNNGASIASLTASVTNDVIGIAFDSDAGTLRFYKNGVAMGASALTGFTSSYFFAASVYAAATAYVNFGQRPFAYTPPTGFVALNTFNLPEPSIKQGNKHFDNLLYTANVSGGKTMSGLQFQPDFIWIKNRDNVEQHYLQDVVRGFGGAGTTKMLKSNSTDAESSVGADVTFAVTSDGYTITDTNYNSGELYYNGRTYASWNWKAGNSAGSSNTAGSITSTVSANASAGFSVVKYTTPASGAFTVGHGLGVAPSFIISKIYNIANNWYCYHVSLGNNTEIVLNTTAAAVSAGGDWNSTSPTSSVFSMGSGWAGSYSMISYCFAEVAGYSKFGSYTGNGSTDGTFVHLGFRPKFVMFKRTDSTSSWAMIDTARDAYNLAGQGLLANSSSAEFTPASSGYPVDFLSNGFKLRATGDDNVSGATYIYAAFAETPTKYALGR